MTGSNVEVDTSEWDRFRREAPGAVKRAALTYFQQGGQLVTRRQAEESKARLGKETSESRMKTADPRRPKGQYRGSVRLVIDQAKGEATVGPQVPYRFWVDLGSEAPAGTIPQRLRKAQFRGHRIVHHGTEKSRGDLATIFQRAIEGAMREATS